MIYLKRIGMGDWDPVIPVRLFCEYLHYIEPFQKGLARGQGSIYSIIFSGRDVLSAASDSFTKPFSILAVRAFLLTLGVRAYKALAGLHGGLPPMLYYGP